MDRIRIVIGDEIELKHRCEELEVGSGDSGESPIDCDALTETGSGNGGTADGEQPLISSPDADFEFIGETVVDKKKISSSARLGMLWCSLIVRSGQSV